MLRISSVVLSVLAAGGLAAAASDFVWSDDAIPSGAWTGADGGDSWNWITGNPTPFSGASAHQSAVVAGIHSHYFSGASATLPVSTGDTLFAYVYLDPANPPAEVMLEWFDGTSWTHAAYWGANLIPWGVNGTASQYPVGALPAAGQWVRIEVPASAVGLEGSNLSGMQFILYNGRATWDYAGKGTLTTLADTTPPTVSIAAPANGASVSGAAVTLFANAADNVGVASVQFKLDGSNLGGAVTVSPYTLAWNSTTVANGSHTLSAVASDAAGNQATATAISFLVSNTSGTTNITAGALPGWVGAATHNWKPRLGGVYWLDSRAVVKQAAPYLTQSSRPVLVDIKSDATGFGYRFDLNSWDAQSAIHSYYPWDGTDAGTPASPEDALNIFGATGKAEFIMNIPTPLSLTASPSSNWGYDGYGYTWQTPQFYAAMVQYLTGAADAQSVWQALPTTLDFSSQPASFNWANLRARRGHTSPYPVVAFILGEEPYNIEGTPTGALYGPQAEKFRVAIRARGYTGPLGLHVHDGGYADDPQGGWFWPMMASVTASDFSYLDLEHYYQFSSVAEDFKRTFPITINPNAAYWMPQSQWKSDYTKFLWIPQDTRNAIRDDNTVPGLGDPSRWSLGWSEHGLQIASQFIYNDMFSAMHWAGWLAESMRQNIAFDSGWTLVAEGFSHAQLQVRNGYVTRTPMFFVYQMAQELYGLDYLTNSYASPMSTTTDNLGNTVQYPWTTVRVLRDPASGNIHLFVVNQSTTSTSTVSGFENWNVLSWKQLAGASYTNNNPLGVPGPEPLQTVAVALPSPGTALAIPPISVNHIVLSGSSNPGGTIDTTPPTIAITSPTNHAVVSGSVVAVSAFASDDVGVSSVQFKLDGANLANPFAASPYALAWDSTTVTNGLHTLTATARDAAGNQTTAIAVSVTVSNPVTPPLSVPTVGVTATSPNASRIGPVSGQFTVTRIGDTTAPLVVACALGGTARNGTDYALLATPVTIPAGAGSVTLAVAPLPSTTPVGAETAVLTLAASPAYTIGSAGSATVAVAGNNVPSSISKVAGNNTKITWSSTVAKTYRVAYKNNLTDATWTNLGGLITATSTTTSYTDTTANGKTQRYYLVYVTN